MSIKSNEWVQGCLWEEDEQAEVSSLAEGYLGKAGRILYFHRKVQHPATIFNANVFTSNGERIWYGDIDIQHARKGLRHLSLKLGALYVHSEASGNSGKLKLSEDEAKAAAAVMVEQGQILYSKKFMERMRELQGLMALRKKCKSRNTSERRFF